MSLTRTTATALTALCLVLAGLCVWLAGGTHVNIWQLLALIGLAGAAIGLWLTRQASVRAEGTAHTQLQAAQAQFQATQSYLQTLQAQADTAQTQALVKVQEAMAALARSEAQRAEAQRTEAMLATAIETLDIGIELYDRDDKLVLFNRKTEALYPGLFLASDIGQTFEALVRDTLRHGHIAAAIGREEEWLAERLAHRARNNGPILQEMSDDRWINTYETRTPEGFVVTARVDVTDQVRKARELGVASDAMQAAKQQAQRSRELLELAIEAMPIGIEIFDETDRLVLMNLKAGDLIAAPRATTYVGLTFEHLLRRAIKAGLVPEAAPDKEAYIAERKALRGTRDGPMLQRFRHDRWVHIYETRTPNNYIVTARVDVSELVRKEMELAAANERLAKLSATDGLTGIANRRTFDEALHTEWLRCARANTQLSLMLIDIDHFKLYNDHYGHLAGDECLRRVAHILTQCLRRAGELVARYGGEEFVLLMPSADLEHARVTAQRCMDRMHEAALPHAKSPTATHVTLSIGIAGMVPVGGGSPEVLVNQADEALYRAKNTGRNRVEFAGQSQMLAIEPPAAH